VKRLKVTQTRHSFARESFHRRELKSVGGGQNAFKSLDIFESGTAKTLFSIVPLEKKEVHADVKGPEGRTN